MRNTTFEIVNNTTAVLTNIINGVASYIIDVKGTIYKWDIQLNDPKYADHFFSPQFRPVEHIKWVKDAIRDRTFQQLN